MKGKKLLLILGLAFAAAVIAVIFMAGGTSPKGPSEKGDRSKQGIAFPDLFGSFTIFKDDMDLKQVIADDPEIERVLAIMKERYGKKLSDKRIQIRLLGGLMRHLKKKNPYDWKERISAVIDAEFPEYAAELKDKLDKLDEYNAYLKEHREELRSMDRPAMKEAMLAKRREIFGHECDEIWDRELTAGKISDMVARLDGRRDLSAYDKMRVYGSFAKSLYPESSDISSGKSGDEIMVRNYELANNFLEMDSVQSELRAMAPDERARFLRQMRLSVGLKEDVVRKMAEADAVRDRMWENGPAYNRERSDIVSKYDGDEREQKLNEARRKYFGENAGMIKFEEDTFKFNRFQFPRKWGRD
ncbi:MAG: hypothetical protein KA369_16215 [Spirochaetes bacterium]|nr:hypothetical protein [Spirochaetota bacterium]